MIRKLIAGVTIFVSLLIAYVLWSTISIESNRRQMHTITKGMSRAEIKRRLSEPNDSTVRENGDCVDFAYYNPLMVVRLCHDSATSAYFYDGKSEIPLFE